MGTVHKRIRILNSWKEEFRTFLEAMLSEDHEQFQWKKLLDFILIDSKNDSLFSDPHCRSVLKEHLAKLLITVDCLDSPMLLRLVFVSVYALVFVDIFSQSKSCCLQKTFYNFGSLCSPCRKINGGHLVEEIMDSIYKLENSNCNVEEREKLTRMAFDDKSNLFLKVLIRYGLCVFTTKSLVNNAEASLRDLWIYYHSIRLSESRNMDEYLDWRTIIGKLKYDIKPNFRTILVILALKAVFHWGSCLSHMTYNNLYLGEYRENFDLIFRITPEPYITSTEVTNFLRSTFNHPTVEEFFDSVLGKFRAVFPDIREHYEPRTLKDLSFCASRKSIEKFGLLPGVLSRLKIPNIIKKPLLVISETRNKEWILESTIQCT